MAITKPKKPLFYSEGLSKGTFQIIGHEDLNGKDFWILQNIISGSSKRVEILHINHVSTNLNDFKTAKYFDEACEEIEKMFNGEDKETFIIDKSVRNTVRDVFKEENKSNKIEMTVS